MGDLRESPGVSDANQALHDPPEGFIPSSPVNTRGDRVLVRGAPDGMELLTQQARATARVQARERVLTHLERIDGFLEVLTEEQLDQVLETVLQLCDGIAKEYARSLIASLPKAIGRIPTYQSMPDPRDQEMVLEVPGTPAGPDPMTRESE